MKCLRVATVLLSTLLLVAVPAVAHADVNDFTVTDFSADYYLNKSDPQGAMDIDEHITVDFTDANHGILRALPQQYNGQDLHLKIVKVARDGAAENYTTYTSNGNEVLKIGNANSTVTSEHVYEIKYSVQNVIRFTANGDELIWNTNGTQWQQSFEKVTATIHYPNGITANNLTDNLTENRCVTGAQGSVASDCTVEATGNGMRYQTVFALAPGENMTFINGFPVGTFTKPTALDWWKEHAATILQIAVPPLLAFAFAYPYWRRNGKDLKGRGTIVPEYAPPGDLHAAEADVINNYKLGTNAISATIIDLAIRKYLKIVEGESNGILGLGKHKTYTFVKLPSPDGVMLKYYEASILSGLFASGETVQTTDLKNSFYATAQTVQKTIPQTLTTEGYFPANPKKVGAVLTGFAIALFFGAWFFFGADWALAVGVIAAAAIVFGFATLMPKRTQKGQDAKDDLAGLKLYMNVAEKDRIAMLQSADAPYATKSDAPQQTVELFEKLLPFAMVLGVEKSWAKQFENIYTTPPDWYVGNWTAFNAGYLVGSLSESMSAMNNSFAAPSSSGAGSGGGFSGGGGGGGGGGGW